MSSRRSFVTAVLALGLALPALSLADTSRSAAEVVKADPEFSTLAKALEAAGLAAALSGSEPVTLLAPTDAAFAKLPAGTLEGLLQPANREQLAALLRRHVLPGKLHRDDLKKRRNVAALDGQVLPVRLERGNLVIGDARVANRERVAANGRIYALDQVLVP